jgi:hypothetical protein
VLGEFGNCPTTCPHRPGGGSPDDGGGSEPLTGPFYAAVVIQWKGEGRRPVRGGMAARTSATNCRRHPIVMTSSNSSCGRPATPFTTHPWQAAPTPWPEVSACGGLYAASITVPRRRPARLSKLIPTAGPRSGRIGRRDRSRTSTSEERSVPAWGSRLVSLLRCFKERVGWAFSPGLTRCSRRPRRC